MVDVFISYSRMNQAQVRLLSDAVKALGYAVWWDDELPPHKSYGDVISEKIAVARAAIVCWSDDAARSEWVRAEADLARNQKKLIQISYDDVMPPMPFNQIQFASLADWRGEDDHSGWRKVKASLTDLCGPPGNPRPELAPPPIAPAPAARATAAPVPAASNRSSALIVAMVMLTIAVAALAWVVLGRQDRPEIAESDNGRPPATDSTLPSVDGPAGTRFTLAATIDDPDGYTNMRARPDLNAPVLRRVMRGEAIVTFDQSGAWWEVQTADGTTGYMSRSRIRLLRDGVPETASATVAPAPVAAAPVADSGDRSGQIFPDSDRRLLSDEEIAGLGPLQLRLARNEIYARRGRRFANAALRNHFSQFGWYRPVADDVQLNSIERSNVDRLGAAERKR